MKKGLLVLFLAFAVTEFLSALHYDPIDFKECSNWDELVPFEHYSEETCKNLIKYNRCRFSELCNQIAIGEYAVFYYPVDNPDDKNNSSGHVENPTLTRGILVSIPRYQGTYSQYLVFNDSICLDLDLSSIEKNSFIKKKNICCVLLNTSERNKIAVWIIINRYNLLNKEIAENRFNILQLGDVECTDFLMNNRYFYFIDKKTDAFYYQKLAGDFRIELKNEKLAGYEQFEKALFLEEKDKKQEIIDSEVLFRRVLDNFVDEEDGLLWVRSLRITATVYEEKDIQTFYCAVDEEGKPILETRMYF